MADKPQLSLCIPCYEMSGVGAKYLSESLSIIRTQECDLSDIEIIVSDHSLNDEIEKCCANFKDLNVKYFKNSHGRGSMSANLNNCIKNSSAKYIKPLFQDDLFYYSRSLKHILNNLKDAWYAHEYTHLNGDTNAYYNQRTPYSNDNFIGGVNSLGPPTAIYFINDDNYFDEELSYMMDTEFYHRMIIKYGQPTILKSSIPLGVVRTWSGQTTQSTTRNMIDKEHIYIKSKYDSN